MDERERTGNSTKREIIVIDDVEIEIVKVTPVPTSNLEAYKIGVYPVTQSQWHAVMGGTLELSKGQHPRTNVSYDDAEEFCGMLNRITGGPVWRLPTGREWGYAARASTIEDAYEDPSEERLGEIAVSNRVGTAPVGTKEPNGLGLNAMLGNVWEWTTERNGTRQVIRGGEWIYSARYCRAASRGGGPGVRYDDVGFRVVRD